MNDYFGRTLGCALCLLSASIVLLTIALVVLFWVVNG